MTSCSGWMIGVGVAVLVAAAGCSSRKSSLLLERQSRGPMADEGTIAKASVRTLTPPTLTRAESGIEITAEYANPDWLHRFFSNKQIFGEFAGRNPYFAEQMVFYIKIANKGGKKVYINPGDFVLVDDVGNQYMAIGPDYATALAEAKAPVATVTRGVLNEARPGYFGFGVPVGKILPQSQWRFALLKMATLQPGYLYPGVVYDGLVSFWNPNEKATRLQLILSGIKTDFSPDGLASAEVDVPIEFSLNAAPAAAGTTPAAPTPEVPAPPASGQ